jgi:hypothetical protein
MSKFPPILDEKTVLERCGYLLQIGALRVEAGLDPKRWLSNFAEHSEERCYAVNLLGSFLYLPPPVFDAIFSSAVHALSSHLDPALPRREAWEEFLDQMIVVAVQSVRDRPSSSGYAYARLANEVLGVPENQIKFDWEAAEMVAMDPAKPVVFVDDFVGTGEQFVGTWGKSLFMRGAGAKTTSFKDLAEQGHGRYFYCPAVATLAGIDEIGRQAPQVLVSPGNTLEERYSAFHPESVLWPTSLRDGGEQFLREVSLRIGLSEDEASTICWKGYKGQGLAIGFNRGTPDATLPIFTWEVGGWKPLLRLATT